MGKRAAGWSLAAGKETLRMNLRTCKECGEKFMPKVANQVFCSAECRTIDTKRERKKYDQKIRRERLEEKAKVFHVCVICGKKFNPKNCTSTCCSKECMKEKQRIQDHKRTKMYQESHKGEIKHTKRKHKVDAITLIQREDQAAGLSYGQYVAQHSSRF